MIPELIIIFGTLFVVGTVIFLENYKPTSTEGLSDIEILDCIYKHDNNFTEFLEMEKCYTVKIPEP